MMYALSDVHFLMTTILHVFPVDLADVLDIAIEITQVVIAADPLQT